MAILLIIVRVDRLVATLFRQFGGSSIPQKSLVVNDQATMCVEPKAKKIMSQISSDVTVASPRLIHTRAHKHCKELSRMI